jgi:RHS repeat-associated protein
LAPGTHALTTSNSITLLIDYDQFGNPIKKTDARGIETQINYDSVGDFTNLYPTEIKTALGTSLERTEARKYDFNTGLVTKTTDVDNSISTTTTYDDLGRPRLVQAAFGSPDEIQTSTEYLDSDRRVVVRSDLTTVGDGKIASVTHYDQLGRIRLTRRLEDLTVSDWKSSESVGIKVQTLYRIAPGNSYVLTSNPYRAAHSIDAVGETTMGWTLSTSDLSGRLVKVETFAGNGLPAPWVPNNSTNVASTGAVTTAYDANFTTVIDQAGKSRRSKVDALGRLVRVDEPDATGVLGTINNPNQKTEYSYDALDNLTHVEQGEQTRTFEYSSLSRLTSAQNPENGTIAYKYDEDGNLRVKTDARGVASHFKYDQLNRISKRWYNNSSAIDDESESLPVHVANSSQANFYYDTYPTNTPFSNQTADKVKGRLTAVTYGSNSTMGDYYRYDRLGRMIGKVQRTGAIDYRMTAEYNRASMMTRLVYPSNREVQIEPDDAGRVDAVNGNLGDGTQRSYSSGILYAANGAPVKEKFGTDIPIYNKLFYNSRGQLAEIRESTGYTGPGDTSWDRGAIINFYSNQCWGMCAPDSFGPKAMTDNNGNLRRQEVYVPDSRMRFQTYSYDSLNRLQQVEEKRDGESDVKLRQVFKYDRWGNRTIDNSCVDGGTSNPNCARWTFGGVNDKQFEVETATNRLLAIGDTNTAVSNRKMRYDAAGNLVNDSWSSVGSDTEYYTRTYDGENRMVTALDNQGGTSTYTYDASGNRIRRSSANVETWQIYGLGGELLAEYPKDGPTANPQKEYGYRNGQLLITAEPAQTPTARQNFALRSNGGSASASSELSASCSNWPARGAIDGDRKGSYWSNNGGWADSSSGNFSNDWLQVDFNSTKIIDELDIFTVQDNFSNPSEPTETMTFGSYGLTSWSVAYWNGSAWIDIPDAAVSSNNKVWRKLTLSQPVETTKIRVLPHASIDNGYSRITEVEAWGNVTAPAKTNVALRANGATATASSELSSSCSNWPARGVIDGDRKGAYWGNTGGWADSSAGSFASDWLEVDFSGTKAIDEVDVFTVQDNFSTPVEPTDTMTFGSYGLTAFKLQSWTGSAWEDVSGASVSNNNKVWVKFTLTTPVNTSKIRVIPQAAIDNGYSRIAEVEAWSPNQNTSSSSAIHWLVADQLGTPRMVFDQTGILQHTTRHDYLPFGEELSAEFNDRSSVEGYAGDRIRQQFTSKERDDESRLDYFDSRYYLSAQGRFTSADSLFGRAPNPQTLNRYAYVKNNPLKFVDPTGHFPQDVVRIEVHDHWYNHIWQSFKGWFKGSGSETKESNDLPGPLVQPRPTPTPVPAVRQIGTLDLDRAAYNILSRDETYWFMLVPAPIPGGDPFVDPESFGTIFLEESAIDSTVVTAAAAPRTTTVSEILLPAGQAIGQAGSNSKIRVLPGGFNAAQAMFNELAEGGTVLTKPNYPGTLVTVRGGGTVGLRTVMSRSPGTAATIDVHIPGIPITKLKFN